MASGKEKNTKASYEDIQRIIDERLARLEAFEKSEAERAAARGQEKQGRWSKLWTRLQHYIIKTLNWKNRR